MDKILALRDDFWQFHATLFTIKWKCHKIVAIFSQNGIPFHRECTVVLEVEDPPSCLGFVPVSVDYSASLQVDFEIFAMGYRDTQNL